MPIVNNNTSRIELDAVLFDNVSSKLDDINRNLDRTSANRKASMQRLAQADKEAARVSTTAWTEFRSAYSTVLDVVRVGQQVWKATAGEFIDYAAQVRDVSRSLGSGTEEASRLIQIADDVGISYQALTTSMKMAQKDGIEPNIEGLAKLSDQYLALAPGAERTKFLLDNFGKSGMEMGKLLEKGSDAIRELNAGVEDSLIITEKAAQEAREYEIAIDDLTDAWKALSIEIGKAVVPVVTDAVNQQLDVYAAREALKEQGKSWILVSNAEWESALDNAKAKRELATAAKSAAEETKGLNQETSEIPSTLEAATQASKDLEDALKAMFDANKEAIDFTLQYGDFQKDYAESHKDAVEKVTEAQAKLNETIAKSGAGSDAAENAREGLDEARVAVTELEATWHEKTQRMIYDMVLAKLAVDGLTDAETKAAEDQAVKMGILTQADADAAAEKRGLAQSIVDGILMQEDVMKENLAIEADRAAAADAIALAKDGEGQASIAAGQAAVQAADAAMAAQKAMEREVNLTTAAIQRQAQAWSGLGGISAGAGINAGSKPSAYGGKRDSGGRGVAGTPYMIGVGAQPEIFIPDTAGTFVPNADKALGATYNIVINNPRKETAENSIISAMKKLSYGVN